MVELDGIQYDVKTPDENANDIVATINDYAAKNKVTNSKGEVINIEANTTNPLYMICYGVAYLISIVQKLIYNVGCAFNIARASEKQLLNIADMAGVKRKSASKTTILCMVYASLTESCSITSEMSVTIPYGSSNLVFHPAYDIEIVAGGAKNVVLICETTGSYSIASGTVTQFDDAVAGLRSITSSASVPGQKEESIADLRQRIQRREESFTQIDKAANAIADLEGVSLCNIFYNYSPDSETIIRDITVPPRQALLLVQGYSNLIAETFYKYMMCLTAGATSSRNIPQDYTTLSGQVIPVNIITPITKDVYIRVYVVSALQDSTKTSIKDTICTLAENLTIAQTLSSKDITKLLVENFPSLEFRGVELGEDDTAYTYKVVPKDDELIVFNVNKIQILEG